jgi:hypothetical protein
MRSFACHVVVCLTAVHKTVFAFRFPNNTAQLKFKVMLQL